MKKILLLTLLLFVGTVAIAQQTPTITFDEKVHDFGEILAGSGNAVHTFTFTNTGTEPLVISNAKPSCGCTVPKWTKEPVMPGETGTIEVTFTTTRVASPKPFTKNITITSNGNPSRIVLTIKGHVVAKLTPFSKGALSSTSIDLGEYKKKTVTTSFEITNEGDADLTITEIIAPDYIKVTPTCNTVVGGGKVTVNVEVTTKGKDMIDDLITINTDSKKTPALKIQLLGNRK